MRDDMLIRDLFLSDVTRDIPPVVYFHEQSPDKVAAEVSEYIITGGWPEDHPNHRRVPRGIHEEYVRLLTNVAEELGKPLFPQDQRGLSGDLRSRGPVGAGRDVEQVEDRLL
jgi:hypothetical protein